MKKEKSAVIYAEHRLSLWLATMAVLLSLINSFNGFIVNRHNINQINKSRKEITLTSCINQNMRHDQAMKLGMPHNLAEALAPKRNCQLLVKQRYG